MPLPIRTNKKRKHNKLPPEKKKAKRSASLTPGRLISHVHPVKEPSEGGEWVRREAAALILARRRCRVGGRASLRCVQGTSSWGGGWWLWWGFNPPNAPTHPPTLHPPPLHRPTATSGCSGCSAGAPAPIQTALFILGENSP